ncbi:decaprenyl-phosphate phosphoribosyltransferase [bacterium]|nr:decaprenyl-phosphate phosphoribosyltransferase [bacterium]
MRPHQWTKNLLLLAGLFFARELFHGPSIFRAAFGFVCFCLVSGSIYILNDLIDRDRDKIHPRKQKRPIASGQLPARTALIAAVIAAAAALGGAYYISVHFFMCAFAYALMMIAYSFILKNVFLIDAMIIAIGFTIRAVAGVILLRTPELDVPLTSWFVICVMFLSMLLAFCKRRSERVTLEVDAHDFRPVLALYSVQLMDRVISICATGAILSYVLYAAGMDHEAPGGTGDPWMMLTTVPFVMFGIFRYLHLVYNRQEGEAPEHVLLTDGPLLGCVVLWLMAVGFVFLPK